MNKLSFELQNVSKSFSGKSIFENLSYQFYSGCYAILGANGAGKSTLLELMAGALPTDSGQILVNNINLEKDPVLARKQLGYIPDKTMIYPFIKGNEFLHFICGIKKTQFNEDVSLLLQQFQLENCIELTFGEMSLGTQKKFMILAGLIGNPSVVILDEPTNGLDVLSQEALINYINLHKQNKIFIIASHDAQVLIKLNVTSLILNKHPIKNFATQHDSFMHVNEFSEGHD